ncbi:unnamed protein product [Spirodela intermedia]|uniref:Thioesterase domain-containing protein n=1 Tax=Spirodela intermedia TaxID=51605 RepID=A0A7I8JAJ0_SPIIN|nr:unnamed protein product [Spirodela intermedia]CAA6666452.1 unnamed protein product [Spirodela intermedia]
MTNNPRVEALPSKTAEVDPTLHAFGFKIEVLSPSLVCGCFRVSPICCQPFKVLHGGVSALIAESLASMGAHMASGFRRVAGIQLSINHHARPRSATMSSPRRAPSAPARPSRSLGLSFRRPVWEVRLWKGERSDAGKGALLASSSVTLLTSLPVPEESRRPGGAA